MEERSVTAWLGLGGNIGDVEANMRRTLKALDELPGVELEKVSSLYATPPWGKTDQPDFLNACAQIKTGLSAEELLGACLDVERGLKRVRGERWGPRTIDIDILAISGVEHVSQRLTVPHPRLTERGFALVPLAELAPDLTVAGKRIEAWLAQADTGQILKQKTSSEWFPAAA